MTPDKVKPITPWDANTALSEALKDTFALAPEHSIDLSKQAALKIVAHLISVVTTKQNAMFAEQALMQMLEIEREFQILYQYLDAATAEAEPPRALI